MDKQIRKRLLEVAKPEKKEFQARIVKSEYPVLGSVVADIRRLAKEFKNVPLVSQEPDQYYEEVLLRGFILAYNDRSILDKQDEIELYVNSIDSWALCDSFCSTFKVKPEEREQLFDYLSDYIKDGNEFQQRYAVVMLLSHLLKLDDQGKRNNRRKSLELKDLNSDMESLYINQILELLNREFPKSNASIAVAWLLAEAFIFYPKTVLNFLENNKLDSVTLNKAISKIRESRTPSKEVKEYVLRFKVKSV